MIRFCRCFIIVLALVCSQFLFTGCNDPEDGKTVEAISNLTTLVEKSLSDAKELAAEHSKSRYDLFETENMWTFILLDTITGRMWQIQYDINGDNRGGVELSTLNLASGKPAISGRFTLHKTQNIYNFILLDQIDGDTWQAQWSMKKENRGVIPIFQ